MSQLQVTSSPLPPRTHYSKIEVQGRCVMAVVDALSLIQTHAVKILAEHNLHPLEAERWYPMQNVVDTFNVIQARIGPSTIRAIGRKVVESAAFPANLQTLKDGLDALNNNYKSHHRGPGNIGSYQFRQTDNRNGQIICDTSYSCDLDEGMFDAICQRFKPKNVLWVRVAHHPGGCRKNGDQHCAYDISW